MAQAARQAGQPNKKDLQAEAARARICAATITCLDRHGYADASIARIQEEAGVSRGALTHHFISKQALVAETGNRLLDSVVSASTRTGSWLAKAARDGDDAAAIEAYLVRTWERVVNTPEGRALVEILMATRTDEELHRELAPHLVQWDARLSDKATTLFAAVHGNDDDVRALWGICRTFLRGLLIQERYTGDPAMLDDYMRRFARLVAPHLRLRDQAREMP